MSVNDTSRIVIYASILMFQILASLTDDLIGNIYDHNMLVVQANDHWLQWFQQWPSKYIYI